MPISSLQFIRSTSRVRKQRMHFLPLFYFPFSQSNLKFQFYAFCSRTILTISIKRNKHLVYVSLARRKVYTNIDLLTSSLNIHKWTNVRNLYAGVWCCSSGNNIFHYLVKYIKIFSFIDVL